MPELYLMRHAKSAWDQPGVKDHDRTLTPQGIERTQKIIAFIKLQQINFDLIVSSTAARARNTAIIMATGLNYDPKKIQLETSMYECDTDSYFEILEMIPDSIQSVLIVAHNPTISEFFMKVSALQVEQFIPTSGLVGLKLNCKSWSEIRKTEFALKFVISPKLLSDSLI